MKLRQKFFQNKQIKNSKESEKNRRNKIYKERNVKKDKYKQESEGKVRM